jgi:DNA-binding SARP family transcriptional activator
VAPVKVMLLGPPRVEHDGIAVGFDTRKAMALLAHLALVKGPRPRDVLAELLWPEHDTEHARGALRRTLSALRGVVGADAVEATRDHVTLVSGAGLEIDVDRFRADAAAGRLEAAAERFHGEFLEGFGLRDAPAFEDWQRGEADALRRELAAVLGRLVEATGELVHARRWLELDPLHEPAHRALIRIYAALGDRAAAVAQYRDCVRTLSRELGVSPLTQTTVLYEAISEGTLEMPDAPPVRARRALPAAPLVGREDEWAALLDLWTEITRDGRVAVIEGEPGIGKTRLAEELLAHARERGAAVLACARSRRRRHWPTARWSTHCAGGCARTTVGRRRSRRARSRRRRACLERSAPNRRHRWTDRPPRRDFSTVCGRRWPPPRLGPYRACCSWMTCTGPMTRRSACSPTGCGGLRAADCSCS